jgi:hypothetical protein
MFWKFVFPRLTFKNSAVHPDGYFAEEPQREKMIFSNSTTPFTLYFNLTPCLDMESATTNNSSLICTIKPILIDSYLYRTDLSIKFWHHKHFTINSRHSSIFNTSFPPMLRLGELSFPFFLSFCLVCLFACFLCCQYTTLITWLSVWLAAN